jgi:hypothetical protein
MFAQAIHATAGIGVGLFIGCVLGFWAHGRSGKSQDYLIKGSVFYTALVVGMLGWTTAALASMLIG